MLRSARSAAIVLVLLAVAAACGSDADSGDVDLAEELRGREFWSIGVLEDGVERELVEGTRIVIRFDEFGTGLGVSAGCNSIGGSIEFDGARLITSELFMTEMGCDPQRHAQDEFVIAVLGDEPRIAFDGTAFGGPELGLETDDVAIRFLDAEVANPDQPVTGTLWTVTGFDDGLAAMSFGVSREATFEIGDDSTVRGFDGCADFDAAIEVADGSIGGPVEGDGEFQFGPIQWAALDGCDEVEYAGMVRRVFDAGQTTFAVDGTHLRIAIEGFALTARAG